MSDVGEGIWGQVVGMELSSVTFVRDDVQLDFDGTRVSAFTPVTVVSESETVRSGGERFRDRLCGQIGKRVIGVEVRDAEALEIRFEDGSSVAVSLRDEDYPGPEALVVQGADGQICVI